MADKTIRLQVDCQEMTAEDTAELFRMNGLGYFFFSGTEIKEIDTSLLPDIKRPEDTKSPAQRLRAVLHVYWSQYKPTNYFEPWYVQQMERYIDNVKERLT